MTGVLINAPSGAKAVLGGDDVTQLIEALWGVSASTRAVALVGKIRHALGTDGEVAVVDEGEADAVRAALDASVVLTPALEELRRVVEAG
jgi:hypothetical protein